MPLPPALLARLQKRGIVKPPEPEVEEEVIAEDYDDDSEKRNETAAVGEHDGMEIEEPNNSDPMREPVPGCPNKWNIYHDCSPYCRDTWGLGKLQPSPKTERKRLKMLKKYPLSEEWREIYDPGTGRHYYWNTLTTEVSWLPPGHPRAHLSLPADKLRALLKETMALAMDEEEDQDQDLSGSEQSESEEEEDEATARENERRERQKRREQMRARGRTKIKANDLDPMDPAAYSEAPRGTWSSGLERKGEAKTGADTTASGPLYQMRPYPSPGAVLRLNAELSKDKSEKSGDESEEEEGEKM